MPSLEVIILGTPEIQRVSEGNYRLATKRFEIWGRATGLTSQHERYVESVARRADELGFPVGHTDRQIFDATASAFDVNRRLSGKAREKFMDKLGRWAEEQKLPPPSLGPLERKIMLDWPGLPERYIPEVMKKLAGILKK